MSNTAFNLAAVNHIRMASRAFSSVLNASTVEDVSDEIGCSSTFIEDLLLQLSESAILSVPNINQVCLIVGNTYLTQSGTQVEIVYFDQCGDYLGKLDDRYVVYDQLGCQDGVLGDNIVLAAEEQVNR